MSPVKEPRFFAFDNERKNLHDLDSETRQQYETFREKSITCLNDYLKLFDDVTNEKAIGEASPRYLYEPESAARIKDYLPEMKLIAVLRDPVERAYSHFLDARRRGNEPLSSFDAALAQEDFLDQNPHSGQRNYLRFGFYFAQLKRYFEAFPRQQVRIYLYNEWKADNLAILNDVFDFLDVATSFKPDTSRRHNISGTHRSLFVHNFLRKPNIAKKVLKSIFGDLLIPIARTIHQTNSKRPEMSSFSPFFATSAAKETPPMRNTPGTTAARVPIILRMTVSSSPFMDKQKRSRFGAHCRDLNG